ncbi:hypothetical protein WA5_2824 [Corynebacterium glutamicum K051]|uniref:Uncharacterized protein n=1 Tax=Corynebacterium glutamicum (strain ATCC 13032 / DSM 20300 / JCM 1318 / BCRC 11384 / CCUG 27702 / LMG 3730 / NBRC 12168 / NCIMB 10025 / NRRL B-2784 / 534) TaxID=196627 RepID=Q8NLL6_CORGL|nr:Hypothetical protein [Corynebacterium glutamicum ATCC 13032]CAF20948.1 hypothetical protein predicted by Glimmer/Critica [Corynebacterium glutamicum ATCC 13032]CCH26044.1 hypothetical protein WA5_2824 [Corynebacterium glutamicum K051]
MQRQLRVLMEELVQFFAVATRVVQVGKKRDDSHASGVIRGGGMRRKAKIF